jgi:hypothetical protein
MDDAPMLDCFVAGLLAITGAGDSTPVDHWYVTSPSSCNPSQSELKRRSFPVIACGHAAGYAIDLEARQPGTFTHLVLIAPTWRGPLPTMMSGRKPIQGRIWRLIHAPVIASCSTG